MSKGASIVGKAVTQRMFGERPGVVQALVAATVAGVADRSAHLSPAAQRF